MEFAMKTLVVIILLLIIVAILIVIVSGWFAGGENMFQGFLEWINGIMRVGPK